MLRTQNTASTPIDVVPALSVTDASDLEYFAEGAANILYRYVGKDDKFKTHLIRLRKYLPNFPTVFQLYTHLDKVFAPLLPTFIPDTKLIEVSSSVLKELNGRLSGDDRTCDKFEGSIPKTGGKRKGKLDETERWGMIVEDMSPGSYLKYNRNAIGLLRDRGSGGKDALLPKDSLLHLDDQNMPMNTMGAATLSKFGWRDILTIEFKPKYLVQSPDAPKDWKLCRTCALRNMRSSNLPSTFATSTVSKKQEEITPVRPEYCPLDLASGDPVRVRRAMEAIVGRKTGITAISEGDALTSDPALGEDGFASWLDILNASMVDLLTTYFLDPICITQVLADLQSHFGAKLGVLASPTPGLEVSGEDFSQSLSGHPTATKIGEDICTAMTLRDCTLFLRFWAKPKPIGGGLDFHVECKVGDLDIKSAEGGKGFYWRDIEKRLTRGEWYAGRGSVEGPGCRGPTLAEEHEPRDCKPSPDSPEPTQLAQNRCSENLQRLSSKLPRTPKVGGTSGRTAAA